MVLPAGGASVDSVWLWAQAESVITFTASFSDHSVQGFSFWAQVLAANKTDAKQTNRILFMDGLLRKIVYYYGLTGYARLRGKFGYAEAAQP
jgi:hypothetical protein